MPKKVFLVFLFCCPLTQSIFAIESDFKEPIQFTANNTYLNYHQSRFSSSGNIKITQGTILIHASHASGSLRNGQPYQIKLSGNPVRFQQKLSIEQGMVYGKANSITYSSTTAEILLTGNASITRDDGSSLSAETIRYNLTIGDTEAKGTADNRVKIVIPPQKNIQIKSMR